LEAELTDPGAEVLKQIKERLAQEAKDYLDSVMNDKTDRVRLSRVVIALTGIEPDGPLSIARAMSRLQVLLARQKRGARCRSHKYDLNKHIAIAQALNALRSLNCSPSTATAIEKADGFAPPALD
jgi:hypothetical protein